MSRRLRIFLATEGQGWSGGTAQTLWLTKGLIKKGHDVTLLCQPDSEIRRRADADHLPVSTLSIRGDVDPKGIWKLRSLFKEKSVDILHAQHPKAHGVCLIAKMLFDRSPKMLVTRRVSFPVSVNPASRIKWTTPLVNHYVAVSKGIRDVLIAGGVRPEKIDVIYSGVDPETFKPKSADELRQLSSALGLDPSLPIVTKVANYGGWKGQSVLLEAASELLRQGRHIQWVFAGRGTESAEMKADAERLGLSRFVKGLGFRTDVADLLALSTLSVNTATEGEGLSGALRESLALGIPVVASNISGNTELVQEGVTGKVVPPSDPQTLAKAIAWMLDHSSEARALASSGQKFVIEQLTVDQMVNRTESLYQRVVS